ncbi:MAG: haloacid dehalogenase type II [Burkholderiaceae bacterium]
MPRKNDSSPAEPFQAVVFDAYGTLFDVHSVATAAEQMFPGQGEALSRLWRTKQLEYSWIRTMSGRYKLFWDVTRDALEHAAARLGLALDGAGVQRLMNQYASLSAFPENLDVLRGLRGAGVPLGILTNGNREMIEISIRSTGMSGLFAHLLSSEQVATFKTAAEVYALVPAAFGCAPERVLFVSSNGWDAIAARWYGFTTFWINRDGAPLERLDTEPHHTGSRLTDVADLVMSAR